MFQGLSAFPLTPAGPDGSVDTTALGLILERLVTARVDAIGLLGSTGIYAYLSRAERRRAVVAAAESVHGRVPLMVGVGALRTDAAQDLARDAEDAGADALLLAPVSYTPLTQDEVYDHIRAMSEATQLPLCLYNNPGTTHFTFGHDLIRRLAQLDNIRAIKMPLPANGDYAAELAALRTGTELAVGYSGDWGACDALLAGADAWYSVVAGLFPHVALALTRSARTGDAAAAHRLDARLQPLWNVFRSVGSLRVMYVLHDCLGLGRLHPPLPIQPPPEAVRRQVETLFEDLRHLEHEAAADARPLTTGSPA